MKQTIAIGSLCFVFAMLRASAADMECYYLKSNSAVTIGLPLQGETDSVVCKWKSGKCKTLKAKRTDRQLIIDVGIADMEAGETYLILHAPDWLKLEDNTPPRAIRFEMDGKAIEGESLSGWLERAPRTILIEIEDAENPINEGSLAVVVNGKALTPRDPQVRYEAKSKNRGVLTCDLSNLPTSGTEGNSITMRADDFAIDDAVLERTISFKTCPSRKMPDGAVITIDSLVDQQGWKEWWVVQDGKVMKAGDPTTAGCTWQSDNTTTPHWIQFEFPKPRPVSKVEIWWAYWECYRTSVKYEIQTWDGEKWAAQAKADGQKEQQCSVHTFPPVTTTKVRILQPGNCGHPGRKELMWMAEVKIE